MNLKIVDASYWYRISKCLNEGYFTELQKHFWYKRTMVQKFYLKAVCVLKLNVHSFLWYEVRQKSRELLGDKLAVQGISCIC